MTTFRNERSRSRAWTLLKTLVGIALISVTIFAVHLHFDNTELRIENRELRQQITELKQQVAVFERGDIYLSMNRTIQSLNAELDKADKTITELQNQLAASVPRDEAIRNFTIKVSGKATAKGEFGVHPDVFEIVFWDDHNVGHKVSVHDGKYTIWLQNDREYDVSIHYSTANVPLGTAPAGQLSLEGNRELELKRDWEA